MTADGPGSDPAVWKYSQTGSEQAITSLAKLMHDPQALSFPFKGPVYNGESGQSYALRMAEENGLSGLPPLKTWLDKSRFACLDAVDAPLLHRWFGADENMLEFALGNTATGRRDAAYVYAGQTLGRSYFLNRTYPRVCPECISSNGFCPMDWDMSLVVACPKHQRVLMDRCDYCRRVLSWNRLRIGTCGCGMELSMSETFESPTQLEIQFSAWVKTRIGLSDQGPQTTNQREVGALMTMLSPLSLDGGFHITYALGTAAGYDIHSQAEATRPKTPLGKARQVLARGNELAEKITQGEVIHFRVNRPSVVVQLLAESACLQGNAADRSLAHSILSRVIQCNQRTNWSGVNPHLSQLLLF